jgi:hypothetical protein
MGEPRAKGIRELRLGFADGGMSCSIWRSENISVGVAMAKRVKSSLEYVSVSQLEKKKSRRGEPTFGTEH